MSVKIISDSACDLPAELLKELNVEVMPLVVYLDDVEHKDGVTISHDEFYKKMRSGSNVRTAQITPIVLEEEFSKHIDSDDDVLYISFSSGLSGTYQTSEMIKSNILETNPNFKLQIIDSKCASVGFGLVVYYAAKLAQEGADIDTIMQKTRFYAKHMEHIFTVNDLEYLYRGGRVSRGSAFVGSMLNIKPILDVEDGKLVPLQKIRGRKKAIKRMIEIMEERGVSLDKQIIGINHADDLEMAYSIKEMIEAKFGTKEFIISSVGCAIGAHSGPGTLSLFFLNELYGK